MSDINERIAALSPEQREALLAKLAAHGGAKPRVPAIAPRRDAEPAPLSFAQQRLWLLHQMGAGSGAYNIPIALRFAGVLDEAALARALDAVVKRHDVLRTRLALVGGEPRQIVDPSATIALNSVDLTDVTGACSEARLAEAVAAEAKCAFDLSVAPLLRATLLRVAAEHTVLVLVAHHTICDGWSLEILVRELLISYAAAASGRTATLDPLPVQYADFAAWQRETLRGDRMDADL